MNFHLRNINRDIRLDRNEARRAKQLVKFVINALIFLMREKCSFFAGIYKEFVFTGSVKDGLKIESPNEFDLNFIFDLQLLGAFIQASEHCSPGFTKIIVGKLKRPQDLLYLGQFMDYFRAMSILMPLPFKDWFFDLIQKVICNIPKNVRIKQIMAKPGKTAMTLHLITNHGFKLSIDICPALKYKQDFLVIPKKHEYEWSLQYPKEEKRILHDKYYAKQCIRLLKRFRDANDCLEKIQSYSLKMTVMWMIQKQPKHPWRDQQADFLKVLTYFLTCLEQNWMGWIFDADCNLWSHISAKEFEIMAEFVGKALKELKNANGTAWNYYFTKK